MPFDAATLANVETALAEGFAYHRNLDDFVIRSGISQQVLGEARRRADARAAGRFERAPKRFVVQELLEDLGRSGEAGDRLVANLVTGLVRGVGDGASSAALDAISRLKSQINEDYRTKQETLRLQQEEDQRRATSEVRRREAKRLALDTRKERLRNFFVELSSNDDAQARGYQLERFLTELMEFEGLEPRASFRVVGEQIDGSFIWRGGTHLTEAKWTRSRVGGAEFGEFVFKIDGKTADTRGLYVAINGYTTTAIDALNRKGALRFVCIDGAHLMRALEPGWSLARILEVVWRHADETGEAYLPVADFREQ